MHLILCSKSTQKIINGSGLISWPKYDHAHVYNASMQFLPEISHYFSLLTFFFLIVVSNFH